MKLRIATIAAATLFAAALSFAADTSLTGQVAGHAGHHVTVKGDVKGDAIKLSAIEMAPEKGM